MKKLLLSALGLLLMAGVASANWSLRQKGDGGTYWTNDKDSREEHVLVTYLVVDITNVTVPGTIFVISPITGTIEKIYSVISAGLGQAGNTTISFYSSSATSGTFKIINEVTNAVSRLTLVGATPSAAGDMREFTPNSATANRVSKGGRIAIESDGGSADLSGTTAKFTIIINPK